MFVKYIVCGILCVLTMQYVSHIVCGIFGMDSIMLILLFVDLVVFGSVFLDSGVCKFFFISQRDNCSYFVGESVYLIL